MNKLIKKITMAAMFASLICVATMIIKIPTPFKGYINIGDCIVLLAGYFLPPVYSFIAAAVGSALADIFSGYINYAPVTFFIKGLVALIAYFINKVISKKHSNNLSIIISSIIAELFMVLGYFAFESIIYSVNGAILNVPLNLIQALASIIVGIILYNILKRVFIEEKSNHLN